MLIEKKTKKTIFLRGLEIMVRVGVHPHEKKKEQKLSINLEIEILDNDEKDCLEKTLNYEIIYDFVNSLQKKPHRALQETIAREITTFLLAQKGVLHTTVELEKLNVFQNCQAVGVRLQASIQNKKTPS